MPCQAWPQFPRLHTAEQGRSFLTSRGWEGGDGRVVIAKEPRDQGFGPEGGVFVSPAPSGCASNSVSPYLQGRRPRLQAPSPAPGPARDPRRAEGAKAGGGGGRRASRPPEPWGTLAPAGHFPDLAGGAGPSSAIRAPRAPARAWPRPPTRSRSGGGGILSAICAWNSRARRGRAAGGGGRGRGAPENPPPAAGSRFRSPGANKRSVCGERGGRLGPGAMRIRWSRAAWRGQRSQGGRGDRSGAAVADTPAGASTPRASATGRPATAGRKFGRSASQRRNPNVVAPQVRRWGVHTPNVREWNLRAP